MEVKVRNLERQYEEYIEETDLQDLRSYLNNLQERIEESSLYIEKYDVKFNKKT